MQTGADARRNRVLAAFPPEILAGLSGRLEPVRLRRKMLLLEAGVTSPYVYFPDHGLVSLVKVMHDGRTAEVGAVGPEGIIGVAESLGMRRPAFDAIAQVDGVAHRISADILKAEVDDNRELRQLLLRYMEYRVSHFVQTAACNRLHTLQQRCYRWLLTALDAVQEDTFTLTHEFVALMTGASRSRLSLALEAVQRNRVISYHYATVTIHDRRALEQGVCECYETLRHEAELVYQN